MKSMKSIGEIVFVDITRGNDESLKLPAEVEAYFDEIQDKKMRMVPMVVILSPDLTQKFGAFKYVQLKHQEFSKIFKDAKKKIREAKKLGGLSSVGKVEIADQDNESSKEGVVTIGSPQLESWESKQGSEIKAMLMRVEHDDLFIFKTSKGKILKVKSSQLSKDSVDRVKALMAENTDKA